MQGVEHALQQYVGRGHQRVRQMPQLLQKLLHQLSATIATEGFTVFDDHFTGEPFEGLAETGGTFLADAQLTITVLR